MKLKKMIISLMLVLLISVSSTTIVFAARSDSIFYEDFWQTFGLDTLAKCASQAMAVAGNSVYSMQASGDIYRYDVNSRQYEYYATVPGTHGIIGYYSDIKYSELGEYTRMLVDEAVFELISDVDTGELYGYCATSGLIGKITAQGIAWNDIPLDNSLMMEKDQAHPSALINPYIEDGQLYAYFGLNQGQESGSTHVGMLVSFDLATGERTDVRTEGVYAICPYKVGEALLLCRMQDGRMGLRVRNWVSGETTELPLKLSYHHYEIDNDKGTRTKKEPTLTDRIEETEWFEVVMQISGLAYHRETDTIAYIDINGWWKSVGGDDFSMTRIEGDMWEHISSTNARFAENGDYILRPSSMYHLVP